MAEPLSITAGGIAVASFAIQLSSSVSKARRFIKDVAGYPEELQSLQEQLEIINDLLGEISKLYNDLPNITVSSAPSTMQKALCKCESNVQILGQKIKEHEPVQSSQRKSQMQASLKMTWKKRDIKLYEDRLSAPIQYLQAVMAVNQTQLR